MNNTWTKIVKDFRRNFRKNLIKHEKYVIMYGDNDCLPFVERNLGMEKQNSVVFRSSAAGYNKRDVNQFILSMNAKFSAAEEGYKKEISTLKENYQKGAQALEKLSAAEAENEALRREL